MPKWRAAKCALVGRHRELAALGKARRGLCAEGRGGVIELVRRRVRAASRPVAAIAVVSAVLVLPGTHLARAAAAGTVRLVSHVPSSAVTTGNTASFDSTTSADGAFVVFVSRATNLVAGQSDANGGPDVFLFERATGAVTLVSHRPGDTSLTGNGRSEGPSVSADGAFVAFQSTATDLVSGQVDSAGSLDVFLFERATNAVAILSRTAGAPTTAANDDSTLPHISADGSFVVFRSEATNLVSGQSDANAGFDVFLAARGDGAVTLVSHTPAGATTAANGASENAQITADGSRVAFMSAATNLIDGQSDANNDTDVFLYSLDSASLTLVSHADGATTAAANGRSGLDPPSRGRSISADGAFVSFWSAATNLVAGQADGNGQPDAFLFDAATVSLTLVSHTASSATATPQEACGPPLCLDQPASGATSISADGTTVAFLSHGNDLVAGQADRTWDLCPPFSPCPAYTPDVFVFFRVSGETVLVSRKAGTAATTGDSGSFDPELSADGRSLAFTAHADDLDADQSPSPDSNVMLFDVGPGTTNLVSKTSSGVPPPAGVPSGRSSISADGTVVSFESAGVDFVDGQTDTNASVDVFVFRSASSPPPPADFDADGDTDVSVFRPSNGFWFVQNGSTTSFGTAGDFPVPGDYDGDGDTDVAVYRASGGFWFVDGGATTTHYGTSEDIPVPGDYDGDGDTDIAVFRPSSGHWFVRDGVTTQWGTSGDIPVPGDYDGDGDTDIAVFRPSSGVWFVQDGATVAWGTSGDVPVPGDYHGDGDTEFAVFRPASGVWFVRDGATFAWGTSGDIPVPGDYDGDGASEFAVFRPSTGYWFVDDGAITAFGTSGDIPLPLPSAIQQSFLS